MKKFYGIYSAVVTPFKENLTVDYETWPMYIKFLAENGINGLFLFGTNGEGPLLTLNEKKELLKIAVDTIKGEIPIIVQVGGVVFEEVIELAKFSVEVGADAISAFAHSYFKLNDDALFEYFDTIAKAVYPFRFFISHLPHVPNQK